MQDPGFRGEVLGCSRDHGLRATFGEFAPEIHWIGVGGGHFPSALWVFRLSPRKWQEIDWSTPSFGPRVPSHGFGLDPRHIRRR